MMPGLAACSAHGLARFALVVRVTFATFHRAKSYITTAPVSMLCSAFGVGEVDLNAPGIPDFSTHSI